MEIGQKPLGFSIETSPAWIQKNEFPFTGTITNVEPVKGKYGKFDYRITLRTVTEQERHFDLWGGNLNYVVSLFSADANNWLGKQIRIERGEDLKRVVHRV